MKKIILSTLAALVATGSVFASYGTAAAQDYPYRPRYDRGYDRNRRDGGYGRDDRRYGRDGGYRRGPDSGNPLAGMSIEDQKRAIKNHRRAQKKAFKRGYIMP